MKKSLKIFLFFASLTALPVQAIADLKVILANESDLPYELSPLNYSNSPSNFINSVSNYRNSQSKYSNSPSKYDNSPAKYDNSKNGNRRLLINQGEAYFFIGYYVEGDEGLINIFSPKGERLFYSPSETDAIFCGEDGEFCGAIGVLREEKVLVLTEKGQLSFMKEEIPLSTKHSKKTYSSNNQYSGNSKGHWIQENIDNGSMIILEDGSIWKVEPLDKIDASLWLPISNIIVATSRSGSLGYDYLLINTDDDAKVHAKYLGQK
jgi:hypothetical protein